MPSEDSGRSSDASFFRFPSSDEAPSPLGVLLTQRGSRWGRFVLMVEETESTNDLAVSYAKRQAPHGSIFLARTQRAGRGRWRRRWESAPGGLFMSIVVRPASENVERRLGLLPLVAAVAVAESLTRSAGIHVHLRWPNDLDAGGGKIGGILCESSLTGSRVDFVVVGVGLNVNQRREDFPEDIAGGVVSVRSLTGRRWDALTLAADIVGRLEGWWAIEETARWLARWRELAHGLSGERIRIVARDGTSFEASTLGVAEDGGLRISTEAGERILYSEDVFYLRGAHDER